ncbi:hypothetical protein KIMH_08050 [Bombiscardovia apis]|uniref:Uncharacterized protein n=1 Tax=Bombiscardovia apis TaxID=2932182 RepID=A0ABN6SF96_9BIFI|nr:hypothetical protein KIMH_08050 [Bombiscardovia apis]
MNSEKQVDLSPSKSVEESTDYETRKSPVSHKSKVLGDAAMNQAGTFSQTLHTHSLS